MDTEVIITGFKVAGALIGGVLGVVGVLFNFKKSNGHVTPWGLVVILGIVLSATVGVVTSVIEGYKARSDAAQQSARTERLLKELTRAIQPITELHLTHWTSLPSEAPIVHSYLEKVAKRVERRAHESLEFKLPFRRDSDIDVSASDMNGPITINIPPKSKFWPTGEESPIGILTNSFQFGVHLRKTPIEAESFDSVISVDDGKSDWIAMGYPFSDRNVLSYSPRTKEIEIFGSSEYDRKLWRSNGKITSVEDLHGAQLILIPPHALDFELPQPYAKFDRPALRELSRMVELRTVALHFGAGREIWIDGKAFKKTRFKHGYPAFSITLPNTDEGFEKIRPRG